MGPVTLFDKSFLQALSLDESVWFDHFYMPVVAPFFFVETLADLAKTGSRSAESEVRIVASKFPDLSSRPCLVHSSLVWSNLMGVDVPMNGMVPIPAGREVVHEGRRSVVWDESPEAVAFGRWQDEQFNELEREQARKWRDALIAVPREVFEAGMASIGVDGSSSRTLLEAKSKADEAVADYGRAEALIRFVIATIGANELAAAQALERWRRQGCKPLEVFAPYACHVLRVEIFFQVAVAASLISSERPSNRIDIGYLYYLPFCQVFVSGDKLHRKTAPIFIREDQEFVAGTDMKDDLAAINSHYASLPEELRETGIMSFAKTPPVVGAALTRGLWEKHLVRDSAESGREATHSSEAEAHLVATMEGFRDAPDAAPDALTDAGTDDVDAMLFKRRVRVRKGSWVQVPNSAVQDE